MQIHHSGHPVQPPLLQHRELTSREQHISTGGKVELDRTPLTAEGFSAIVREVMEDTELRPERVAEVRSRMEQGRLLQPEVLTAAAWRMWNEFS